MANRFHRYFCGNCGKIFKTGKFHKDDLDIYDDVCPYCGALACTALEYLDCLWYKLWHRKENK